MMAAVRMERTGSRSRSFSGSVVIDASPDDVWAGITDYDRAADIVPTLTSRARDTPPEPTDVATSAAAAAAATGSLINRRIDSLLDQQRLEFCHRDVVN